MCSNTKPTLDHQPSIERMKIMANHVSATEREETPHVNNSRKNLKLNSTISVALKRRAESVINNKSIDATTRAVIRYGLETNDPWLSELVRRADAGETVVDDISVAQTSSSSNGDSSEEKIEALAEMICRAGDEPAAS